MIPVMEMKVEDIARTGWKRLNYGCSRTVYENANKPGIVLKHEEDCTSNKRECDIWESLEGSAMGFLLTPIHARNEDYSLIIMKRVEASISWSNEAHSLYSQRNANPLLRLWDATVPKFTDRDFHRGNWAWGMDDYGEPIPTTLLDYAGVLN